MKLNGTLLLVCGGLLWGSLAMGAKLPGDNRLDAVRPELQTLITELEAAGVPADGVIAKVQEGLAKHVPPARILTVAKGLAGDYRAAKVFAASLVPKPSAGLIKALVDAKASGVKLEETRELVRAASGSDEQGPVRALGVLGDLAARGYPVTHAVSVVSKVLTTDPQSLGKLGPDLDRVRKSNGLSQAEALDSLATQLARGGQGAGGLERAIERVDDDGARGGNQGTPPGRGPDRDSSGSHGHGHGKH